MKRYVLKKLGALALSAALTASLVPGAWAADYKGADLNISGSVRGSGSQYSVQYAADLSVSGDATNNDIIALVNMARANEGWLEALRFTCYLEDSLLKNAVTSGDLADLDVNITGNTIFDAVSGPSKTSNGVSMTYELKDSVISALEIAAAGDLPSILTCDMEVSFSGTLTNSEVWNAVGSASSISTSGYVLVTYAPSTSGDLGFDMNASVRLAEDTYTTTISPAASGGSSSGGSSGSGSSSDDDNKTETTTNPDGSTTTTVTKPDGTVIETTKYPDGSKEVVETEKDGSSTTTVEKEDGSTSTTTVDENGQVETEVSLSSSAISNAKDEPVALPMPEVPVTKDWDEAPVVTVSMTGYSEARVEIPVEDVTPGTVAVLVKADGSEQIIKTTLTTENGIVVTLEDGATVKVVDNSKDFVDVPNNYWGSTYIDFATSRGLFSGTSESTFAPDTPMNRAMIVTVLAAYEGVDTTTGSTWYEAGRQWAMANGISDGTNMNQNLTREQLAVMLWRYAGSPTVAPLSGYSDLDNISDWAEMAMAWAVRNGMIAGMDGNMLNPGGQATRAQVATILMRFVELTAE